MKERITLEILSAGQPRAYATSIYRGIFTIEWHGMDGYKNKDAPFVPRDVCEGVVKSCYARMLHGFSENTEWHEARITKIDNLAPGRWEIEIKQPYLD